MKASEGRAMMRSLCGMLLCSMLVACASAPPPQAEAPSFDVLQSQAETLVASSGPAAAIPAFEQASRADPTRKEPWVRIAQLQFDSGNYASAIMAAEEVLQRDPEDAVADGVLTVAGFRIANQSLLRLQARGALDTTTARSEAKTLADTLRATMGDAILSPAKPATRSARRRSAARSSTGAAAASTPPASAAPSSARPASSQADSDPFKNIRGN